MNHSSRSAVLVAAIVISQLVAVYLLVTSLQNRLTTQLATKAEVSLDFLAESVADRAQRFLQPVESAVIVTGELIETGVLDPASDPTLEQYFIAQLHGVASLSGMFVGRDDGSFLYVSRNGIGLRTKRIKVTDGGRSVEFSQYDGSGSLRETWTDAEDDYDPRQRPWYKAAKSAAGLNWTDPYTFYSAGLPGITVASETTSGVVLAADVNISELSKFIAHIPHARHGSAIITDAENRAIAYSRGAMSQVVEQTSELPTVEQVAGSALKALHASIDSLYEARAESADATEAPAGTPVGARMSASELKSFEVEGRAHVGVARPLSLASGLINWTLLVQVPADEYSDGTLGWFDRRLAALGILSIVLGALTLLGLAWLHRLSAHAARRTERDELTGALHRIPFERRACKALSAMRSGRDGKQHAVVVVELQDLRYFVDKMGVTAGNRVLAAVSEQLESAMRAGDLLGRAFQSRFLAYIVAGSEAELFERIVRLHALARNASVSAATDGAPIRVATGAAVYEPGEPASNVLQRAREAVALGIENGDTTCSIAGRFLGNSTIDFDLGLALTLDKVA